MSTPPTRRPRITISNARILAMGSEIRGVHRVCELTVDLEPRAQYLRLLQAWVECLPHQPAKRRFVEGALVRARAGAVRA